MGDQIREFFFITTDPIGIDHIHAVRFVKPSSVTRLSPTEMCIFDSALSIFGKNTEMYKYKYKLYRAVPT
jgi:hypothetical protein